MKIRRESDAPSDDPPSDSDPVRDPQIRGRESDAPSEILRSAGADPDPKKAIFAPIRSAAGSPMPRQRSSDPQEPTP